MKPKIWEPGEQGVADAYLRQMLGARYVRDAAGNDDWAGIDLWAVLANREVSIQVKTRGWSEATGYLVEYEGGRGQPGWALLPKAEYVLMMWSPSKMLLLPWVMLTSAAIRFREQYVAMQPGGALILSKYGSRFAVVPEGRLISDMFGITVPADVRPLQMCEHGCGALAGHAKAPWCPPQATIWGSQ